MGRIPVPSKIIRGYQYVLENDFTGGLKTEFTGLNFPENACTSTENCTFFHTGAIFRRNGFDYESGFTTSNIDRTNSAISTFVWTNVGGDGNTKIYVLQVGASLYFYQLTNATLASPLSTTKLVSTVALNTFSPPGAPAPNAVECQYAAGNGYLFVFHPSLDSFYCVFSAGAITPTRITINIRDFTGISELGVADSLRPGSLNTVHNYNINNQGWVGGTSTSWNASSSTVANIGNGTLVLTVAAGIVGPAGGQVVSGTCLTTFGVIGFTATVTSYSGTTLILNVTGLPGGSTPATNFTISFAGAGSQTGTFHTATGVYPSNADVWWSFKDSTGLFNPASTVANVTLGSGPAPKGYYILSAFNQRRSSVSGLPSLTDVSTFVRPKTGTWFQGRVWYAGSDASFAATGTALFSTWTENIYFSQIINDPSQFGKCYQVNDPTSETLFDVLPSDGGVITIQGAGSIFKLFPVTNGLLVFAANGVWFITGSTGIGFTAVDYTVSKLAAIQSISSTSYVDVLGYPIFWNEEGIYSVSIKSEQQGLSIDSLTLNTIKQFYDKIPKQSKKFARGSYNPITGQVQWLYRNTNETGVTSRYEFDSVLTFSMFTQAFYPWQLTGPPHVHDVTYVVGPGGSTSPLPVFKYLTSNLIGSYQFTFSEERDNINWKDWNSTGAPVDYSSFFITGYKLHGDAQRKFQPMYVFMYSDNAQNTAYKFNGKWNFALSGNSGKVSTEQIVTNTVNINNFSKLFRRHRLRGRGTVLQLQIASVSGKPFHIDGWALTETQTEKP